MYPTRQIEPHINRFVSIVVFETEELFSSGKVVLEKFIDQYIEFKMLFGFEYMLVLYNWE